MENRHTVALIWGGRGCEREISRAGMENILPLIDKNTYKVLKIHIEPDGRWMLGEGEIFLCRGGISDGKNYTKIDCAFPMLHGDFGEDGRVQGALDCADISYVGCDTAAGAICRDKLVVKALANSLGIPTLPCVFAVRSEGTRKIIKRVEEKIGYPAFIKPCTLGSSLGAAEARNNRQLFSAIRSAFELCDRIIVERCISPKRELECGYLKVKGKELFTKCGEVLCDGFYSYEKKYRSPEVKICPVAEIDENINRQVVDWSATLVRALGVKGLSRIDYFLSGDKLFFNEINTMPGQTDASLYPKMIEASGIPRKEYINLLIEEAIHSR